MKHVSSALSLSELERKLQIQKERARNRWRRSSLDYTGSVMRAQTASLAKLLEVRREVEKKL